MTATASRLAVTPMDGPGPSGNDGAVTSVGILHPGAMGSSLGAAAGSTGHAVHWTGPGRSEATRARAEADGLRDAGPLEELVASVDLVVSVCPPDAALDVAGRVAGAGFGGVYLDANAVSPATARAVADVVGTGGATVVDGGIIGPPARTRGLTVLYLSGDRDGVGLVEDVFAGSPLATHGIDGPVGAASATKMAFAAWTKGTSALLLAIRTLAEREGVTGPLSHAWSVLTPDLPDRLADIARGTGPKAWRFAGEMDEIAATFTGADLPSGFHEAAAAVFRRLADLRDRDDVTVEQIIERL